MTTATPTSHPRVTHAQHVALFLALSFLGIWYRLRYDIRIVGDLPDVPQNCVVFTNHRSTRDSFLFGSLLFGRFAVREPWRLPWNVPKRKWYVDLWPISWILALFRTVPVHIDEHNQPKDPGALRTIMRLLREGNVVHLFPEGTRSRTEHMNPLQTTACSVPLLAQSSILLAYYARHGNTRIIQIGPCLSEEAVAALAGEGRMKDRAQRLAEKLQEGFSDLARELFLASTA